MPEEELALAAVPTESIEAYDLYLLGRYHWRQRTKESIELARDYFLQAIEIDPEYVPALAGLADSYISLVFYGTMLADDAYPLAQQAIDQAMALDDSVSEVWASQGLLQNNNRNFSAALSSLEHAIELNPKNVEAWYWLSFPLQESGRLTEAFEAIKKANELEPMIPSINNALARFYEGYGDFARRRQYLERVAQSTEARRQQTNVRIAESYLAGGDIARAVEDYRASLASAPDDLRALAGIGAAYLALGDTREAERWYDLAAKSSQFFADHHALYLARKDFAGAISLLENTLEQWAPRRPDYLISNLFKTHYLAGNNGEARGYLDELMETRQGRYEIDDKSYNQSEGLNIASFWIHFGDDATGERQRGLELAREIRDKFAGLHAQGFRHPQLLAHLAAAEGILGNHKVAFGFLEAAIDKGFRDAFGELTQPIFDPLRDDAGFAAVTERIAGLSAQERARLEGIELAPYTPTSRLKPIALPRKTIERFLGYYTDRNRIFHLFMSSDGQLMGSLPGFGTGPLFMASEIRFFSTAFPNQYGELAYDEDGIVSHFVWHAGTNTTLWKRIPDLPPAIQLSADVLSRFEGVYAYDELGGLNTERTGADTLVAVISRDENGTPWIDYEKQPKLELEAVSESVLRVKGFVGRMEFEFDPDTGAATRYTSHSDTGERIFVRQEPD
jgi:tetratricopeptide (TPR) repeat protein